MVVVASSPSCRSSRRPTNSALNMEQESLEEDSNLNFVGSTAEILVARCEANNKS